MEIKELQEFSKKQHERLAKYYGFDDPGKLTLPETVKIIEELGELCAEVLAHSGLQRKDKLDNFNKANLEEEFADVIITTTVLAENLGIDVEESLKRKIEKIEKRGGL